VGLYVTHSCGAASFYERAGFTRFGRIDDFPPACATFLQKTDGGWGGDGSAERLD